MAKSKCSGTRYRLFVLDADGMRINGTGSSRDMAGTKRIAVDILRTLRGAASVEISSFDGAAKFEREVVTLDSEEAYEE